MELFLYQLSIWGLAATSAPTDAIVRYAGDEFLVVARGTTEIAIEERISELRNRLRVTASRELPIRFSYGVSRLDPGGNPDEAVKLADEAMYRSKAQRGARSVMVADRQAW
ncbi:MAG: diguanylate cyclase [Cyanobacteria bacterium]|nr:diguanylate cyclase [Cyanobacteriota bacterium]